ncbi:MAG TPA: SOS response-associated peptidase [Acidimicrobiales bacterium]|nr:SOS response-associated peptidase [Acidimicrobiales bacterium]
MCGRFVAASTRDLLVDWFGVEEVDGGGALPASYNVAPTDDVYTVADDAGRRRLTVTPWGLVAGDGATPLINARSETVTERPVFREAFERRRCLIPADGFYEWETMPAGGKQPYLFAAVDGGPVGFAGLYGRRGTCAIVTSAAAPPVARLHERMPVIVARDRWDVWLDADADMDEVRSLLVPPPEAPLVARPVSPRVNDVHNNDPTLLDPVAPPAEPLHLF